jgi:hypothetical protein
VAEGNDLKGNKRELVDGRIKSGHDTCICNFQKNVMAGRDPAIHVF